MAVKKIKICDFCNEDDDMTRAEYTCELCKKDFCDDCGRIDESIGFGFEGDEYECFSEDVAICCDCREMYENLFENKEFKKKMKEIIDTEVKKHLIVKNLKGGK